MEWLLIALPRPNTKHQTSNTKKLPNSKSKATTARCSLPRFGVWNLGFLWCLVFGVWCFAFSFGKHFLQLLHVMPAGERDERFVGLPFCEIRLEHAFQQHGKFVERNAGENLFADARVRATATAENDVVTFHRFAAEIDLHALQSDVADVVLRAGIGAAGEVDVEGMIEVNAFVEMRRERERLPFRIGGGPFA